MLTVACSCGKLVHGSEAMAGQSVECMKCRRLVAFPAPARPVYATVGVGATSFGVPAAGAAYGEEEAKPENRPAEDAAPKRLPCELYYWVFLLALAPLGIALIDRGDNNLKQRLERTLQANPQLKARVQEILDPHFPDAPRLSARHLRQNPGIPSVFSPFPAKVTEEPNG